jgi:long-chain acyl-CoA synthetase
VLQGYGLTECSPIVTANQDEKYCDDSIGLPLPGVEVKIVEANAEGFGELVVKGDNVMLGYFGNTLATEKVLKDGWLYTGDLGNVDSSGFYRITGRKKNVIVTKNGKNIYPEEIETLLNRSPYIKECIVFGKDDAVYGDVVISAAIVPDIEKIEEEFKENPLTKEDIYELIHKEVKAVNKTLVTYKYVKDFNLREEEFAKTTTKKIKRYMEKP